MTLTVAVHTQTAQKWRRHDGSLILQTHDNLYKVHRTLLERHSQLLATLYPPDDLEKGAKLVDGLVVVHIPDELEVKSGDLEILLEYLYHDVVSSQQQLDFPSLHTLVKSRLEALFPAHPEAFLRLEHAEEALALSVKYDIPSICKPLYYTVATHPHEHESLEDAAETLPTHTRLSPELTARCDALLESLVAHFTPVLFTVATAGHMACTDVFAEQWMPLVIQPALDDNGLCRPLETLERVIAIDWAADGVCAECVKAKTEEWRGEQKDVWEKTDVWLE